VSIAGSGRRGGIRRKRNGVWGKDDGRREEGVGLGNEMTTGSATGGGGVSG
jgi:hypothetical protein